MMVIESKINLSPFFCGLVSVLKTKGEQKGVGDN